MTDEFLGKITPDGFFEPKGKRIMHRFDQVSLKEFGVFFLLQHISPDITQELKSDFPEWKEIFKFACMRLLHVASLKNVSFLYATSYLSETIRDAHVPPDSLGDMLRRIGNDRNSMGRFMKSIMKDDRYLAVDLTHVLSMSEGIISATLGHNSMDEYLPQVQVLFLFSLDHDSSEYFRMLPCSINSVASLMTSIEESGVKRIVLVGNTGFYFSSNIRDLDSKGMFYIIPLRRRRTSSDAMKRSVNQPLPNGGRGWEQSQ